MWHLWLPRSRNIMHWGTRNKIAFAPEEAGDDSPHQKERFAGPDCRTKPPKLLRSGRSTTVSARVGWHIDTLNKTLSLAVLRYPSGLEDYPYGYTLQGRWHSIGGGYAGGGQATLRIPHSNGRQSTPPGAQDYPPHHHPRPKRGLKVGGQDQSPEAGGLFPQVLRPTLRPPHYTRTAAVWTPQVEWTKETAAAAFKTWWNDLPPDDITIFLDGSEQYHERQKYIGCYNIRIKWSPGHTEIEGNEAADRLADTGAHTPDCDPGPASLPTISGIGSIFRDLRSGAQQSGGSSARQSCLLTT
ncbi:hypothetical protein DID88_002395 [Monilinia fructigena]|uniref:RNase H type-1 domain-containing protein n=1 Tax=Monilinia fructigena TaxID=38457 RepID=A0A395ID35_9HELO|nr:hypothetical protein DID88_002395 [Monilinia fructigena]